MSFTTEPPMVTVHLPPALCDLFPGSPRHLQLEAASVREVIDGLDRLWPGMADRLRDSRPRLRKHISVMVDGERLALPDRVLPDADLWILTAISGG